MHAGTPCSRAGRTAAPLLAGLGCVLAGCVAYPGYSYSSRTTYLVCQGGLVPAARAPALAGVSLRRRDFSVGGGAFDVAAPSATGQPGEELLATRGGGVSLAFGAHDRVTVAASGDWRSARLAGAGRQTQATSGTEPADDPPDEAIGYGALSLAGIPLRTARWELALMGEIGLAGVRVRRQVQERTSWTSISPEGYRSEGEQAHTSVTRQDFVRFIAGAGLAARFWASDRIQVGAGLAVSSQPRIVRRQTTEQSCEHVPGQDGTTCWGGTPDELPWLREAPVVVPFATGVFRLTQHVEVAAGVQAPVGDGAQGLAPGGELALRLRL